jgi:hypothetical protein
MSNSDATAMELRRMLKSCPACGRNLDDHSYASVATTIASPENQERLGLFCRVLETHDWPRLMQFDDFDPLLNALEAFAIKCAWGWIVLVAVRNPFELFESSRVLDCEVLDSNTGKALRSLIAPDKWRRFSVATSAA